MAKGTATCSCVCILFSQQYLERFKNQPGGGGMSAEFRLCVPTCFSGSLTQSCPPASLPELSNALLWRCLLKGLQGVYFFSDWLTPCIWLTQIVVVLKHLFCITCLLHHPS